MAADELSRLLEEGTQLFKEGKLDEAIAKLKAAVDMDPANVQAHSYLGAAYAQDGQGPASVEQFQAAVDLDPNSPVYTFNLAHAYEVAGSKPRAIELYQKALAIDPKYAKAQQKLDALTGTAKPAPAAPAAVPAAPAAPAPTVSIPAAPVQTAPQYTPPQAQYSAPPQPSGYAPPAPVMIPKGNAVLEQAVKSRASWLYFIAGLSILNTVVSALGIPLRFAVGLGVTSFLDAAMHEASKGGSGSLAAAICLPITLILVAVYATLGYFASKGMRWAFITGLVLYSLDTILVLLALLMGDLMIVGIIFHIWALVRIGSGIGAAGELGRIREQQAAFARQQAYQQQPPTPPLG